MYEYQATVIRVIDGDSMWLDIDLGLRTHIQADCRVYGINAPEIPTSDGIKAKSLASDLMPNGTVLNIVSKKLDKYGRPLVVITLPDGRDFGNTMLAASLAVPYMV